jgi:hypothetical protein
MAFCYAFSRATTGVSYCAPAYAADKLCTRAEHYLKFVEPTMRHLAQYKKLRDVQTKDDHREWWYPKVTKTMQTEQMWLAMVLQAFPAG